MREKHSMSRPALLTIAVSYKIWARKARIKVSRNSTFNCA